MWSRELLDMWVEKDEAEDRDDWDDEKGRLDGAPRLETVDDMELEGEWYGLPMPNSRPG